MRFGMEKIDTSADATEYFVSKLVTVTQVSSQATLDFMGEDFGDQIW